MTQHIHAAPAAAYALASIAETPIHDTAAPLLALATLADRDLYGGNGYTNHTAAEVAAILPDMDPGDVLDALAALVAAGILDGRDRDDETPAFRIPQIAYDRSNGDA